MIRSRATPRFWDLLEKLPSSVQTRARKQFALFAEDPSHPSLHLKPVGGFWSVRISDSYRALAVKKGEIFTWFWIATHDEYERTVE